MRELNDAAHKLHWAAILAVVFLGAVVWVGVSVRGAAESFRFRRLVVLTCSDFARLRPKAGWYRVTGCTLDLASAGSLTWSRSGDLSSIYAPAVSRRGDPVGPVAFVVETERRNDLETVRHLQLMESNGNGAKIPAWLAAHHREAWPTRDVEGIVRTGEMDRQARGLMASGLAPGYVVLREGDRPSLLVSLRNMALSAGLAVWVAFSWPWYLGRRLGLALRRLRLGGVCRRSSPAACVPDAEALPEKASPIIPLGRTVEVGLATGSELVIPAGYLVVVVRKGRIYDRLVEGRHAVSREGVPILASHLWRGDWEEPTLDAMCYLVRLGVMECPFEGIVSRWAVLGEPIMEGVFRGCASLEIRDGACFVAGILDLLDRKRRDAAKTTRFLTPSRFWGDTSRTAALLGTEGNQFFAEYLAEGVFHFAGEDPETAPPVAAEQVEARVVDGMAPALERLGAVCTGVVFDAPAEMLLQPCLGCGTLSSPLRSAVFRAAAGFLLWSWEAERRGNYCRACGTRVGVRYLVVTLLCGWWGLWALITTPFHLVTNGMSLVRLWRGRE